MLAAVLALPLTLAPGMQGEVAEALASLRIRRYDRHPCYFITTHGWPGWELLRLMEARFDATPALLDELEWLDRESWRHEETQPHYRNVLYYVLAMVKDPAAIPWLLSRVTGNGRAEVYDVWLPMWGRGVRGPSYDERAWLEGETSWNGAMRALATHADTPRRRLKALEVLQQWFHDEPTVRFFEQARTRSDLTAAERLTVELFFERNGLPVDGACLPGVIDELKRTREGRKRLHWVARTMRHEAFVPWFLSMLEPGAREEFNPRFGLDAITHRGDLRSASEWRAWWDRAGHRGREAWVAGYVTRLYLEYERLEEPDQPPPWVPIRGLSGDLLIVNHLTDLARHPGFRDEVPSLAYSVYRPHLREQLGDVLFDLASDEDADPAARGDARRFLVDYDYVPGPERGWMASLPYPRGP